MSTSRAEVGHDIGVNNSNNNNSDNRIIDDSYSTKSILVTNHEVDQPKNSGISDRNRNANGRYSDANDDDDENGSISDISRQGGGNESDENDEDRDRERRLVRKVDLRLCTIAGILCSLNLLDSGIISSASVTTIFEDLGLGVGNRYVSFASSLSNSLSFC